MGIPIYRSPPSKDDGSADKTTSSAHRCATPAPAPTTTPPSSSSASASASSSNMLTLDEFLRETTSASAASNDLQTLLLMHRPRRTEAGRDSFDTLVSQIRRIGALQDVMLSNVDAVTTNLEDADDAGGGGGGGGGAGRRERNRSAVDALRIREARLRAMQTRIDLLASEFALLRSTRRELRREAQAMESQDARRIARRNELDEELNAERRAVRRPLSGYAAAAAAAASSPSPEDPVQPPTTLAPVSIDRRSPLMTLNERDLILRNTVMQMQLERLAAIEL